MDGGFTLKDSTDMRDTNNIRDRLAIVSGVRSVMVGLGLLKSGDEENAAAGSAVRKYSKAFNTPRKSSSPRRIAAVLDDDGSDDVA